MVHGDGLSDLEEPDQFETVHAFGAGLVLDLRQFTEDGISPVLPRWRT